MKTPSKFLIYDLRLTIWKKSPANRQSSIVNRQSSGMALVLTLIMLSVILVMVVAFLAISRRERNAVSTTTDTAIARFAADSALAAAQAQIVGNILSSSAAAYNYHLLVSTNYIDSLNPNYSLTNIGNNLPCPPVMTTVDTNYIAGRFYLDLNRNGKFDPSGWVAEVDSTGATNGNQVLVVGDPEWIGVLERPDAPHANNNKFISRYAFLAQPIGNGLDLNHIHNQTITKQVNPNPSANVSDGYFRNQGIGSWELNLAAFLADLNTNVWDTNSAPYFYRQGFLPPFPNTGNAFEDALSLLSWRYNFTYNSLYPANKNFANLANYPSSMDGYSDGPLQITVDFDASSPPDNLNLAWAGSANTNRFFALLSELPDPTKSSVAFTNRLLSAGFGKSTYDSYTFYRLLDQLGTDSTADDGRMNLNYDNLDTSGNVVSGAETNLIAWTPLRFFTNAANRLLTNYTTKWLASNSNSFAATFNTTTPFGLTNIPVLVSNQFVYTPAVNRLLQLAANIYDATTNSPYPSVFRPIFLVTDQGAMKNVYINGYQQIASVIGANDPILNTPTNVTALTAWPNGVYTTNVYGVPWIIGAKKGLPNFNQFSMLNGVEVTRKLQVTKPTATATLDQFRTNQMYIFSITNLFGSSFWNSYTSAYTGNITVSFRDNLTVLLTNDDPGFSPYGFTNLLISVTTPSFTNWPGMLWQYPPTNTSSDNHNQSFISLLNATNAFFPTNGIYRFAGYNGAAKPYFDFNDNSYQTSYNTTGAGNLGLTPPLPHFGLLTTNRLQAFILNGSNVIDYVHFAGPESFLDLNHNTNNTLPDADSNPDDPTSAKWLWSTNGYNGGVTPSGVVNQLLACFNYPALPPGESWSKDPNLQPQQAQAAATFKNFFATRHITTTQMWVQAVCVPTRLVTNAINWQANDPLVHYLASDLDYATGTGIGRLSSADLISYTPTLNFTNLVAYSPWGVNYYLFSGKNENKYVNAAWLMPIKDPLVWRSDDWDFPTNKFPTPGWLGRIHRGTPWQTVYLKASNILATVNGPATWAKWMGNTNIVDATNAAPVQDRGLFDLFATTLHPNATFGTLAINQGNMAAWSAVFSGLVVLTNSGANASSYVAAPIVTSMVIDPAGAGGANTSFGQLFTGITNIQQTAGPFEHLGDILSVPQLTEQSPFLNFSSAQQQYGISDQLYEWLPQQTLGLLRVSTTPRYVIYCYGQTLRPAANSIVTSGGSFGLVTNYQVVAESAARAVVRVDKHATTTGTNYSTVIESYDQLPPQ